MINFKCDSCEKSYSVNDDMIGKRAKCACGTIIVVPTPSTTLAPTPSGTNCPHCNSIIQPSWKGCPACGGALASSQVVPSMAQPSVQAIQPAYGQSSPSIPPSSGIQVGNDSVIKANVNQSINVAGDSSLPKAFMGISGQGQSGNIPSLQVGDGSVVKADIDASVNYTNQGQIIGQQNIENKTVNNTTVIHESGFAKLVTMVSSSSILGADETDKLMDQIGNNPYQLMILAVNAMNSLSRTLSNYAKDNFKETPKGILNPQPTLRAINNKIDMAHKILNRIHESSGMRDEKIVNDIEKIDEIIRNAKKVRDNYPYLSMPPYSFLFPLIFNTASKNKDIIDLIKSDTDYMVKKYS